MRAGELRKIGPRLYTRNTTEPVESLVRRSWQRIAALYFPGAVVADRSAFEASPAPDGSLYLDAGPDYSRKQPVRLPGLTLRPRRGVGPVAGDMPFMDGLHFAGPGRKFLENMRASRARPGDLGRTLSRIELEDELVRLAAVRGRAALDELRAQAGSVAAAIEAEAELAQLEDVLGSILGTRDSVLSTEAGLAHQAGTGFDPRRIEIFQALQARLLQTPLPERPEQPGSFPTLSFIESYLSNFIEGTEFELGEAEEIVFGDKIPEGRFEDAHDVLGTFELVNDRARRARTPHDGDDLLDLLRTDHAVMLARRPQVGPGAFKHARNQVGDHVFVHPDLVVGTLLQGFGYYESLPRGMARAIFATFLVAEVHPFADGNGRVARVVMNAELSAAGLQRIVIPISYRDNYLQGLRAASRHGNPAPLIRILDFAQGYAAAIDWRDLGTAEAMLKETNALLPSHIAEERGVRLQMPTAPPIGKGDRAQAGGARQ
ncbi:MAG TPA: Fic family protein [Solirubrobacterales bacterium]